jgi:hypothetical protein
MLLKGNEINKGDSFIRVFIGPVYAPEIGEPRGMITNAFLISVKLILGLLLMRICFSIEGPQPL